MPSASKSLSLPSGSSTQHVMQSKRFSTYSSSSVPFEGSRFLKGLKSCSMLSIASCLISCDLLAAEDCRRIARTSAEYCLFWLTIDSVFCKRDKSHLVIGVSFANLSAIDGRDERFSTTPVAHQSWERTVVASTYRAHGRHRPYPTRSSRPFEIDFRIED